MKKCLVSILLVYLLFAWTSTVWARTYIGDESPEVLSSSNSQITEAITAQTKQDHRLIPFLNNLDGPDYYDDLVWYRWPFTSYYFQTAPSSDGSWVQGKMEDAASSVLDTGANMAFFIPKLLTVWGCGLTFVIFSDYLANSICSFVSEGVPMLAGQLIPDHLSGFLFYVALALLGFGIAFYLARGRIVKAFTNVGIAIVCLAFFYIYVANVGSWVPGLFDFINSATGMTLSATTYMKYAPAPTSDADYSGTGDYQETGGDASPNTLLIEQGIADCTNAIWDIFVGSPWALGQFGESNPNNMQLTSDQVKYFNTHYVVSQVTPNVARDLALAVEFLTGKIPQIPEGSNADTVWLAGNQNVESTLLQTMTKPGIGTANAITASGQGQKSGIHHLFVAFMTILPAVLFFVFIIVVGLPVFFAQVMIMICLFIMPLALLLGMAGDSGIGFLQKFLKAFLGFIATKIIYGFYIGITLMMAIVISRIGNNHDSPGTALFLLALLFGSAIYFHKDYFNAVISILSFTPSGGDHEHHHGLAEWIRTGVAFAAGKTYEKAIGYASSKFPRGGGAGNPPSGGGGGGPSNPPSGGRETGYGLSYSTPPNVHAEKDPADYNDGMYAPTRRNHNEKSSSRRRYAVAFAALMPPRDGSSPNMDPYSGKIPNNAKRRIVDYPDGSGQQIFDFEEVYPAVDSAQDSASIKKPKKRPGFFFGADEAEDGNGALPSSKPPNTPNRNNL